MQKLTNKEEEIMQILWKLKKAFVKEVMAEITEDQPHYNTLSTIIRNLEEKGYVSHNAFGNTHQYFPIVKMEDYRKRFMNTAIENYFGSSYKNMVSFFAQEEKISAEELREILEYNRKKITTMETVIIYLLKSSGLIMVFYLAYFLFLRKETFFSSNRWFLLAGLFSSVLLPLVFFTKIIWVEPTLNQTDWSNIPVGNSINNETFEINWLLILGVAYSIGLVLFLIKFGIDFFSLTKIIKGKSIQQQEDYKFIDLKENLAPFSYFNYIVYNSDLYSPNELENILEHEKVHSAQNHSVDVLISRIFCIVFWYNPFIWLYKKAILQNLEFIADSEATKNIADKKAYQITLLKITTHENCVAISNHFYQSLIKKRIVMLNKNQSKKTNYFKYALIIPVLVAFVFLFQIKVIAQEKESHSINQENKDVVLKIDKNTTDEVLKSETLRLKQDHNIVVKFSKVKRNNNGEIIGIKVAIKDEEGNESDNQVNGNKPIQPMTFVKTINENGKTAIGYYIPNDIDKEIAVNIGSPDDVIAIEEIASPTAPEAPLAPLAPPSPPSKIGKQTFSNTLYSDEKPLIVIDGVKKDFSNDYLSTMDPGKIQSITVLKGLEADAKYGKEGEKGVIVITTKTSTTINSSDISEDQQAKMDAIQAKQDAEQAKMDAIQAKSDALQAKEDAKQARKDIQQARIDAQQAKKDADQARKDANLAAEQAKKDALNK